MPLQIKFDNRRKFFTGVYLVLLGFGMPLIFTVQNFGIFSALESALHRSELTELLFAALRLIALNALRGVPHYIGSFFIGESMSFKWKNKNVWWLNALTIILSIYLTYFGIGLIHGIRYDYGLPAVLASAAVIVFKKMDYQYISSTKKIIQIILVFISFQFLDIMPALNRLPVGRGEVSTDIKLVAELLEGETLLNAMGVLGFVLFMVFAALIFYQLREENQLRELDQLREQNQAIKLQNKINEMKNRTYQEIQYLVHDLKSPLAAVQTLVGVIKMESEAEQAEERVEYLTRIEQGIERMSEMISEILYEDKRSEVTTEKVLATALAQMSVTEYSSLIQVDNQVPGAKIFVNRILFPRVLVNLVQNSAQAIPKNRKGEILIRVDRVTGGRYTWVAFSVMDNGAGIPEKDQHSIWEHGVSNYNSSGMGLAFVKKTVERSGGKITFKSVRDKGTAITVYLPEKGEPE